MNKIINKKSIIFIILLILIILLCIFYINHRNGNIENTFRKGEITVNYEKNNKIDKNSIKKGIVYKNTITVTNNSKSDLEYKIIWKDISNKFKEQNKLLYMIDTHDSGAAYLSKSQLPVTDFTIFKTITIKKGATHKYEIKIDFQGDTTKEKNSTFTGELLIKQT